MIYLTIGSLLVGAVFGLRFKVLVLLPLSLLGLVGIGLGTLLVAQAFGSIVINFVVFALSLQGGYLFGSLVRFTIAGARTPPISRTSSLKIVP
jgi:hypothetical protein